MTDQPRKGIPTGTFQHLFMDDDLDGMDDASADTRADICAHQIEANSLGQRSCLICGKTFND